MPKKKEETTNHTFVLELVSVNEIIKIISSFKPKGPGHDDITMTDIQRNVEIIAPHITQFINDSLEKKEIPDEMKITVITPINKNKGKKNDI